MDDVTMYLTTLSTPQRQEAQEELVKFARWFGRERKVNELSPREVEEYVQQLASVGATTLTQRLAHLKGFLNDARKRRLTAQNLAPYAKVTGTKGRAVRRSGGRVAEPVYLTTEGYQQLKEEMEALRQQQGQVAKDIRRAAEDKDVRENAPLEAAREQQGHLAARIQALEITLRTAVVKGEVTTQISSRERKVTLGTRVVLQQSGTQREVSYLLVSPSEADPLNGKLSAASPVGQALLNRALGEEVEVTTPGGRVRYHIVDITG